MVDFSILDPNAPAKVGQSYFQGQQNALAMRQAKQQEAQNALLLQQRQRQAEDENALRQAYAQSGGDPQKLVESMRGAGLHQQAMEMEGQLATQQAAARKAQIEDQLKHFDVVDNVMASVRDAASYEAAKQRIAAIYGPQALQSIPAQYDPNAIEQAKAHALGLKGQLEQQWKALDYDMKQRQFGFEQTKFGQQQALERAKMGQAERHFQATQGLEREKMSAKSGDAGKPAEQIKTAQDALTIIDDAEQILNRGKATGSYAGKAVDVLAGAAGISTPGAKEAASLKALAGALVSKMPKMSGPQSDKDVQLYREMAGQIGDETVPIDTRKAALKTVRSLQEKYAGQKPSSGAHPSDIQDLLDKYK